MAALKNKTQEQVLVPQLEVATSFFARSKGLLGRSSLAESQGLWIHRCNSIHTFFMQFSIDCVFVDRKLKVKALKQNVHPWRLVLPIWGASSVIEMKAGEIQRLQISVGDELYVGA